MRYELQDAIYHFDFCSIKLKIVLVEEIKVN